MRKAPIIILGMGGASFHLFLSRIAFYRVGVDMKCSVYIHFKKLGRGKVWQIFNCKHINMMPIDSRKCIWTFIYML